jgi:hypothetical protein
VVELELGDEDCVDDELDVELDDVDCVDDALEVELADEVVVVVDDELVVVELDPVSVVVPVLVVEVALSVVELVDVPDVPGQGAVVAHASAVANCIVTAATVPIIAPTIPNKTSGFALTCNSPASSYP